MKTSSSQKIVVLQFAVVIFVSAFLLFQVQPLIGKYILPWFGGTSAVWTTCMLFFQFVLFAGYLYAHLLTRYCSPRIQGLVHFSLLIVAAALMPITPEMEWKPTGEEAPIPRIIILLGMSVGIPFFALSSTGPLLQRWFSQKLPSTSPYRLYALSNVGSLLALISYPFVFDPQFAATQQTMFWSVGFWLFAVLCGLCALTITGVKSRGGNEPASADESSASPSVSTIGLWFGLAMSASVMLLAVTNQVCLDVASVPFLWVMPLTLYLISFIICFDNERWYSRWIYLSGMFAAIVGISIILNSGAAKSIFMQAFLYFLGLFFCCMVCHGELARLKPAPKYLTLFYLIISAGGAAGGLFVGLIAPLLFSSFFELHIGLGACYLLTMIALFRDREWIMNRGIARLSWIPALIGFVSITTLLTKDASVAYRNAQEVSRTFYGVLRVIEVDSDDPQNHQVELIHGRILHGKQFLSEKKKLLPTSYYGRESAVGRVLLSYKVNQPRKIGVVGLGIGTLASYAKQGDEFRFYEINADVLRLAKKYFSFLSTCQGEISYAMGDARLSLEREDSQQFDVLVLDAFSGDAIPTHLLTKEAGFIYLKHLKEDGILAIHISNRHLDLRPVIAGLANYHGLEYLDYNSKENKEKGTSATHWMLIARKKSILKIADLKAESEEIEREILWTDEKSNLFEVLKTHEKLKFW